MLKTRVHSLKAVPLLVCALGVCLALHAQEQPNLWAVVVGVSKFQNFKPEQQLEFADADAQAFYKFITSPRGRNFPPDHVKLLLNEKATYPELRQTLRSWLPKNAKPDDIVYVFIATHGMVEKEGDKQAFLVTSDALLEDLYATALPMNELSDIIATRFSKAKRTVLFADACRSGKLGVQQKGIHQRMQEAAKQNADLAGVMASGPREFSQEGKQFCGGHGAFTCYLLQGMNGAADSNKDNIVTIRELTRYVIQEVPKATGDQQEPNVFGDYDPEGPMSYPDRPTAKLGFENARTWGPMTLLASLLPQLPSGPSDLRLAFDRAIKEGRLLAPAGQSAWELYQRLDQSPLPQADKEDARDSLAIALEGEGQKVLVAYLRGDATPLSAEQYHRGAEAFSRAGMLLPDFPRLKAKASFCDGRALLADGKIPEAETALRESIKIDADGAYTYNALGIAYMHLGRYPEALGNFQLAVERAPKWAYPHYNRALTYTTLNRLPEAERAYKEAIARGPDYVYLHLNLGELYRRMNRQTEAERELKKAIELAPGQPYAYNMLGLLYHTQGKLRDAEDQFRQSIQARPDLVETRVNLAQLLVERNGKDEAERVLREALKVDMRSADAHRALGALLLDRGSLDDAETEFTFLQQLNASDPRTFVLLGDVHFAQKRLTDAANDYRQALQLTNDPVLQREVERKLRRVKP